MTGSSFRAALIPALLVVQLPATSLAGPAESDPYAAVNSSWDRLGSVYGRIVHDYYTAVPPDSIMLGAIAGMLERLDAYSEYYDAAGVRQLRQDTTGRFAGLGITVARMDGFPVVVAAFDGTPAAAAGLITGDQIRAIEGESTYDMTLDEVVNVLRGEPGSSVHITVHHPGPTPVERALELTRQMISIPSVALVDEVAPGVGYIGMRRSRFSEATAAEVEAAITQLRKQGVASLILDLRGNPGGLLSQAAQVADLFLPRGAPIVAVRERGGRRDDLRRSQQHPAAGDLRLAVLIDGGSASAAEIVAGAVQDNDRGLVVGTVSFGKGSVQTIFDLRDPGDTALKLTTARYYTPSGRSIHREHLRGEHREALELQIGDRQVALQAILETVAAARTPAEAHERLHVALELETEVVDGLLSRPLSALLAEAAPRPTGGDTSGLAMVPDYRTRRGRKVHGGGGITPDVQVQPRQYAPYVQSLQRQGVFFEYAVHEIAGDSAAVVALADSALDAHLLARFAAFAGGRRDVPEYTAHLERQLLAFQDAARQLGVLDDVRASLDAIASALATRQQQGFPRPLQEQLLAHIRPHLALRLHGRAAELRAWLQADPQLERAIHLLSDPSSYARQLASEDG